MGLVVTATPPEPPAGPKALLKGKMEYEQVGVTPVPLKGTSVGLIWFVALCVTERFVEAAPVVMGEN